MEQVELYLAGERDYINIKGGTGPLVYPAAHVYIYWALYHITNKGTNILMAQRIFGVLYLGTLAVVMACYKRAKVRSSQRPSCYSELADDHLLYFTGSHIHPANAHTIKTSPQHLCPAPLQ